MLRWGRSRESYGQNVRRDTLENLIALRWGRRTGRLRTDATGDIIHIYYAILRWGRGTGRGQVDIIPLNREFNELRWDRSRAGRR